MSSLLWVGIGGFLGSIARYALSSLITSHSESSFPSGTFIVNVLGCFVIGIVYGLSTREMIAGDMRLFLATGICGGFTTFSAFSAECLVLIRDGNLGLAALYCLGSILCGVSATFFGLWLLRSS